MSNLVKFAKQELEMAGFFDEEDFYGGLIGKSVMELIEVFDKQGHSGMSASAVRELFNELANHIPINAINGTDDEWINVDGEVFQNKRLPALFKQGKYGKPYYLDAIVWRYPDGYCFTGTVEGITSRQYIKLPFLPKTFYVDVTNDEKIIDRKSLEEANSYYECFM
jgi:hypothetical protein